MALFLGYFIGVGEGVASVPFREKKGGGLKKGYDMSSGYSSKNVYCLTFYLN